MLKIATWNVNSLRVRLRHLIDWLEASRPDVVGIQETKLTNEEFPFADLKEAGYTAVANGQKTYNGVALLGRRKTEPDDVATDLPGLDDPQRRVLAATCGKVRVINLYVPNGYMVGSEKYDYKLYWLDMLASYLKDQLESHRNLAVLGDFNIAPEDRDVYDPEAWEGSVLVSGPEREAFRRMQGLGLTDVFRLFEEQAGHYSWWNYQRAAFRHNRGLRIDHILASRALSEKCTACYVDKTPRGWERPSDHAPVVAEFKV